MLRRFFLVLAARLCRPEDLDVSVILHDEAGRKPAQIGVLTPRTTHDEAPSLCEGWHALLPSCVSVVASTAARLIGAANRTSRASPKWLARPAVLESFFDGPDALVRGDVAARACHPREAARLYRRADELLSNASSLAASPALVRRAAAALHERLDRCAPASDADARSAARARDAAREILRAAHAAHVARAARLGAVYFHHVSKSGGTELCTCAWLNRCRAPAQRDAIGGNCWPRLGVGDAFEHAAYGPRWITRAHLEYVAAGELPASLPWWADATVGARDDARAATCAGARAFANASGWSLIANENFLHTTRPATAADDGEYARLAAPCAGAFVTLTRLRSPLARLESHLRALERAFNHDSAHAPITISLTGAFSSASAASSANVSFAGWLAVHAPGVGDNIATRAILGEDAWALPVGAITRAHAARARRSLEHVDVVLALDERDDGDSAARASEDALLAHLLGWAPCERSAARAGGGAESQPRMLTETEREVSARLLRHDAAVFEHARRLAFLDTLAMRLVDDGDRGGAAATLSLDGWRDRRAELVQMLSEGGDDSAARRWLDEQAARPARDCGLVARAEEECAT